MRISVAMATYNGERFIAEQLDSLARQTLPPAELVIHDDGSSDRTLDIAEAFAQSAAFPVRIRRNPQRLGWRDNFLVCAAACGGDYIAFCDQDDVWHPDKLRQLAQAFSAHPQALLVIHQGLVSDEQARPTGSYYPRCETLRLLGPLDCDPWFATPGFAMCFARRLLDLSWARRPIAIRGQREVLPHDQWIYFLANVLGSTLLLPQGLVNYRRHAASVTAGRNRRPRINPWLHPRRHVADKLEVRSHELQRAGDCLLTHEEFLQRTAGEGTAAELQAPLLRGAERYGRWGRLYQRRARLCGTGVPRLKRLHLLAQLIRDGGYAPFAQGGSGGGAELRRDLRYVVLGVLFGA